MTHSPHVTNCFGYKGGTTELRRVILRLLKDAAYSIASCGRIPHLILPKAPLLVP